MVTKSVMLLVMTLIMMAQGKAPGLKKSNPWYNALRNFDEHKNTDITNKYELMYQQKFKQDFSMLNHKNKKNETTNEVPKQTVPVVNDTAEEEIKMVKIEKKERKSSINEKPRTHHPQVLYKDPEDFEPQEWLSNSSEYFYYTEFLVGLALLDKFPNADNCIDNIFAFMDDWVQFQNNYTFETEYVKPEDKRYVYPPLNFTGMWAAEASVVPAYCWDFGIEVLVYIDTLYQQMGRDFNMLLISFLFTQMGNAARFKTIIDAIQENTKNQDFELNMLRYGELIHLILLEIQVLQPRGGYLASLNDTIQGPIDFATELLMYPDLENYTTFDSAFQQIQTEVSTNFWTGNQSESQTIADMITIASTLGVAYLVDLQKNGVQLITKDELDSVGKSLLKIPAENQMFLQEMVREYQDEIDFVQHHLPEEVQQFRKLSTTLQQQEYLSQFISYQLDLDPVMTRELVDDYLFPALYPFISRYFPAIPVVGTHNTNRLYTFREALDVIVGFKDGIVGVTGNDSLYTYCNNNVTRLREIYYDSWQNVTADLNVSFNEENWKTNVRYLLLSLTDAMQWPFFVLYSCYWAGIELYTPYNDHDFPQLFEPKNDDGSYRKLTWWEHLLFNILFNLGYQVLDVVYITQVTTDEYDYFYRTGYASGDLYMRFYYRTLYDAPVR